MRQTTHDWALSRGFSLFAQEGYRSPTVTTIDNREKGIDVHALATFMENEKLISIDKGYGKIKGDTFRVAHMGEVTPALLDEYMNGIDEFMGKA